MFHVFSYDTYDAQGGLDDYETSFNTLVEAIDFINNCCSTLCQEVVTTDEIGQLKRVWVSWEAE